MQVDAESSDESEDEVCIQTKESSTSNPNAESTIGRRILYNRNPRAARSKTTDSGIFSTQVGFSYR